MSDWDRKDVHFCVESYQACQEVGIACGIKLSTWVAPGLPWKKSGNQYGTVPDNEKDLGYSFRPEPVSCLKCIVWMEEHLNRCQECGALAVYSSCVKCAEEWMYATGQWKRTQE
jgi:hypothetical protein